MSDTIIRVENLGKKYIIGHQKQERYLALRDAIANSAKSAGRKLLKPLGKKMPDSTYEEFWALKDVSFEIKRGDRVGIIGRNGAGKSTLLKILSRITEPTTGRISIKGRVASLLEVGTGFHPELTGRENIYLNGAILGMSKVEIKSKFDEIVAFAEVEKFLDTPVKRYSSGMYVRLAFAVAAHLEPEILVVDEVLAVGDTQFQKKCLGKMEDIGKEGRTVLFVSHNMGTMIQLCTRAVYLVKGQVADIGHVNSVVSKYLMSGVENSACVNLFQENDSLPKKPIFFREIAILNHENEITSELDIRNEFSVRLTYEVISPLKNVEISIRLETDEGRPIFTAHQSDYQSDILTLRSTGTHQVSIKLPSMFLVPGSYLITIIAHEPMRETYDIHEKILSFTINETGTKLAKYQKHHLYGVVVVELPWLEHC